MEQHEIVLITGVGGMIGSALAEKLAQDYTVIGLDQDCQENTGTACLTVDLTDDQSVEAVFEEFRGRYGERIASVIHLAAYFDFTGESNPLYRQVNVQGTRRLLRALQGFRVGQFVYSGTMLVHAPTQPGKPITEESPLEAKWAYPQSKLEAEQVIREEHGDIPTVLLRIAGLYHQSGGVPTLTHQIQRIYERSFKSHVFAGDPSHGQSYVHLDDLLDAFQRVVERRTELPRVQPLLIGEAHAMSYAALQNELGELIHGEDWKTLEIPKPVAEAGAWVQEKAEPVIPDSIDQGEKPFIRSFMIDMADDHYELDTRRARELLGWRPEHSLRDTLPAMVAALKDDPLAWYRENGLTPPQWQEDAAEQAASVEILRREHEDWFRLEHSRSLWAHFINMGLGAWLITSPAILGYPSTAMLWSDVLSGVLVVAFAALSLSWRFVWARWANAAVGVWLLFAPLAFWTPLAGAYLNGTLVGALVIGFAVLVRPPPGVARVAQMSGPDIPPGWDYSPSTWMQRLPIIILAFVGLYVSRYLTAYQLEHIDGVWEPFFAGRPDDPKNGTEEIITSWVSEAWPVPDAGVGALTYTLEILTGMLGSRARWRTMPWLVILFGIMIVPLGTVSIFFIVIQPILLGTWCTLCLLAAAAMLWQIPYSFDEILATCQFLYDRHRKGKPMLQVFFKGDTMEGGAKTTAEDFTQPPGAIIKDMLGGGVNLPWTLLLSMAIGVWLMLTRLSLDTTGAMADSDHLTGALVITVSISALAEVARPLRFVNALFGLWLIIAPWVLAGASPLAAWLSVALGVALIVLSIPRARISHRYGGWNRYIV